MSRPIPENIHPDYSLPEKLARTLKVDKFTCYMPAQNWADIPTVNRKHMVYTKYLEELVDAFKTIINFFKDIGDKCLSMAASYYARDLYQYYGNHKTDFITWYTNEKENQQSKAAEQQNSTNQTLLVWNTSNLDSRNRREDCKYVSTRYPRRNRDLIWLQIKVDVIMALLVLLVKARHSHHMMNWAQIVTHYQQRRC